MSGVTHCCDPRNMYTIFEVELTLKTVFVLVFTSEIERVTIERPTNLIESVFELLILLEETFRLQIKNVVENDHKEGTVESKMIYLKDKLQVIDHTL